MRGSVPTEFECMKCGNCCTIAGSVTISESDLRRASLYLGISPERFAAQYTDVNASRSGLVLKDQRDGCCVFLQPDRTCLINPAKPRQCAGFPKEWNYNGWTKVCSYNYTAQRKETGDL